MALSLGCLETVVFLLLCPVLVLVGHCALGQGQAMPALVMQALAMQALVMQALASQYADHPVGHIVLYSAKVSDLYTNKQTIVRQG